MIKLASLSINIIIIQYLLEYSNNLYDFARLRKYTCCHVKLGLYRARVLGALYYWVLRGSSAGLR
jgi:hypothetical protein